MDIQARKAEFALGEVFGVVSDDGVSIARYGQFDEVVVGLVVSAARRFGREPCLRNRPSHPKQEDVEPPSVAEALEARRNTQKMKRLWQLASSSI